eukprot:6777853-Prymnesium_polylepis.2
MSWGGGASASASGVIGDDTAAVTSHEASRMLGIYDPEAPLPAPQGLSISLKKRKSLGAGSSSSRSALGPLPINVSVPPPPPPPPPTWRALRSDLKREFRHLVVDVHTPGALAEGRYVGRNPRYGDTSFGNYVAYVEQGMTRDRMIQAHHHA